MKTVDILIKARDLIAVRNAVSGGYKGWTQFAVFRDASGVTTSRVSEATCFCSLGAVLGVLNTDREDSFFGLGTYSKNPIAPKFHRAAAYLAGAAEQLRIAVGVSNLGRSVIANDTNSHEDVMRMFDRAIRNAKRRHVNGDRRKAV